MLIGAQPTTKRNDITSQESQARNSDLAKLCEGTKDGKLEPVQRFVVSNFLANLNNSMIQSWNANPSHVSESQGEVNTFLTNTFDTLKEAYEELQLTQLLNRDIDTRPEPKSFARFEKKGNEDVRAGFKSGNAFTDLFGARVHANSIHEIKSLVQKIVNAARDQGFEVAIKQKFAEDDKPTDITAAVYLFPKDSDFPIEVQVGHPFANLAFATNSTFHGTGLTKDQIKNEYVNPMSNRITVTDADGNSQQVKLYAVVKEALLQGHPTPEQLAAIKSGVEDIMANKKESKPGLKAELEKSLLDITQPAIKAEKRPAILS